MRSTRTPVLASSILAVLLLVAAACGGTPAPGPTTASEVEAPTPLETAPALNPTDVHPADGAGRWYPAQASKLRASVEAFVGQAEMDPLPGTLLGVIVPHAGYVYSEAVAGHAFRAMRDAGCSGYTLVVIGDTHTGHGTAAIAVWAAGGFETPLGLLPVDEVLAQRVVESSEQIRFDREAFQDEHPVENQLPFLQVVCPGAKIVPVVVRDPSLENAQILSKALVDALRDSGCSLMIVASTDLSHYHPYDEARQMDEVALQAIVSLDPQNVADSPRRCAELGLGGGNPSTMCSQGAVMTALIVATSMGADQGSVLNYANSGDTPIGERSQVVGYGAVALWKDESGNTLPVNLRLAGTLAPEGPVPLSPESRAELLALARRTAAQFLAVETFPSFRSEDPAVMRPMGAYVTYERDGELRGCVGRLEGDRPAYLNVQYAAVAAAVADSRFPPISPEELEGLTLEITLLEPMRQVASADEIQIGRDGVLMRVGGTQGALFLPQVPLDQGWDLETTLINLCRKAGLPDEAWQRPDAQFYVFGGQWFSDGE